MKDRMLKIPGKRLIADSIYKPGKEQDHQNERGMFSIPRSTDDHELKVFKSRVRCRHESVNAHIKNFCFAREAYHTSNEEKHGIGFRAIYVLVQYQMDNGSPLFEVN